MKSTFGRLFLSATLILLAAILLIGLSFQLLLRSHLAESTMEGLREDANVYSALASAYSAQGDLLCEEFRVNLSLSSRLTGTDAVLCDRSGRVLLCSDSPLGCRHQGLQITSPGYVDRILTSEGGVDTGAIDGLYDDIRYVVAQPVRDPQGMATGLLLVSAPVAANQPVIGRLSSSFITVSVLAVVLCLGFIVLMARLQARPLRQLSKAAHDFGHGHLDARVEVRDAASQELQELALSFNNMASSLQKSEAQRQEFVANISHELKTPLTTISGYIDGILDGTIPPEKQEHYMRLVSQETKRLSRLVRSMLEISRLQDQGISEERKMRFDICELAGQVLIRFEQQIEAKQLDVQVQLPDYPHFTRADPEAVTQILYNLVENAVKFCDPGKKLGLQVRSSNSKLYISVSNQGKTIPPQELPLVFDRFHKTDKSRTENRDGWGLGLYIVKSLVSSHGENISVTSRDGQTEFTFTLPLVT